MIRVLFVDDEQRVLDGLKRMLRKQRHDWDMVFAMGGQEALTVFEAEPFDVVVSDMMMPGMDGVQLLSTIREKYPQTIRIALSGHADAAGLIRAVGPTHQFLSKPCPPEVLKATVERAMSLRRMIASDSVMRLVSGMDRIPSVPSVYRKLLVELRKDGVDLRCLGDIVETDLGMSAFILKLVNSAFFGSPRRETSIDRAISLIGLERLSSLVLVGSVFQEFDGSRIPGFSIQRLWHHSIRSARFASAIGTVEGSSEQMMDDVFTAALLHDVGKLVLASNLPEAYAQVMVERENARESGSEVEKRILGATHGQIGAYLLGVWGLPDSVVEAVAYHDEPRSCGDHELALCGIVHLADVLARDPMIEDPSVPACGVSLEYLRTIGLLYRWADWRAACLATMDDGALV